MWPQVLQKCSQNKMNTFNWKGKTSCFPLSMLGSERLKDGELLGRDKMSKDFGTGYDSSSANNNAHPAKPLHSVYKQSCLTAFSATSHLRSACFIVDSLGPSQLCLEAHPSALLRLQSSEPGSRGGWNLQSQMAVPCQQTNRVWSWQ